MGKGDRRTTRGKRNISSYGNRRPRRNSAAAVTPKQPVAKPAKKKA